MAYETAGVAPVQSSCSNKVFSEVLDMPVIEMERGHIVIN